MHTQNGPNDYNTWEYAAPILRFQLTMPKNLGPKVSYNSHCVWYFQSCRLLTQPSNSASLPPSQIFSSVSEARGLKVSTSSTSSSSSSSMISPLVLPAALALRLPPTLESLGLPAEMPPLLFPFPMESTGPRNGFFFRFANTKPLGEVKLAVSL